MKKEYRIKKSQEIEKVLRAKKSVGNKYFVVYKMANKNFTHYRVALSVGKKYGIAVKRNEMKRRLRHIIRDTSSCLDSMDIFIVAKPSSNDLSFEQIEKEVLYLLNKNNLIRS